MTITMQEMLMHKSDYLTIGSATGRLVLIGSRALMPPAATAASGDGGG